MTMQHTPGPWARAFDGIVATKVGYHHTSPPVVCRVEPLEDEEHANAQLIAAAPDLLAALERCAAYIEAQMRAYGVDMDYSDSNTLYAARAAIAKAKGAA